MNPAFGNDQPSNGEITGAPPARELAWVIPIVVACLAIGLATIVATHDIAHAGRTTLAVAGTAFMALVMLLLAWWARMPMAALAFYALFATSALTSLASKRDIRRPARWRAFATVLLPLAPATLRAQATDSARAAECHSCSEWNAPHAPLRLFGNTWYVGTNGLSAILITSAAGDVLIDAGLPESAPLVLANIRALGFRVEDVKLIVNSHAHFDHAGGIAAVQRVSGADVAASAPSAAVLRRGASGPDDPQFGIALAFPAVPSVTVIADGDTLRVGTLTLVAHLTPGHTPGGTSWSWRSCDVAERCLDFVYADSQTPVSADGFLFTRSTTYPGALTDFARGQAVLEALPCDVLLTPHPSASRLWERVATGTLVNRNACREFAAAAREAVARRVAAERAAK